MAKAIVYLNFNGNCREAMQFYKYCIGGNLELQSIGDSAMAAHMPNEPQNHILHSSLTHGDLSLMASDMIQGSDPFDNGNAYNICFTCETQELTLVAFNKLAAGGRIIEKLAPAAWGGLFGMLTDQYGKSWMFHCGEVTS